MNLSAFFLEFEVFGVKTASTLQCQEWIVTLFHWLLLLHLRRSYTWQLVFRSIGTFPSSVYVNFVLNFVLLNVIYLNFYFTSIVYFLSGQNSGLSMSPQMCVGWFVQTHFI